MSVKFSWMYNCAAAIRRRTFNSSVWPRLCISSSSQSFKTSDDTVRNSSDKDGISNEEINTLLNAAQASVKASVRLSKPCIRRVRDNRNLVRFVATSSTRPRLTSTIWRKYFHNCAIEDGQVSTLNASSEIDQCFHHACQENVYLTAFTYPIRSCCATRARVPSSFLMEFELLKHPDTGRPWLLPTSLVRANKSSTDEGPKEVSNDEDGSSFMRGKTVRYLARKDVIEYLTVFLESSSASYTSTMPRREDKPTPKRLRSVTHLLPPNWTDSLKKFIASKLYWRPDMPVFVEHLMQENIVKQFENRMVQTKPNQVNIYSFGFVGTSGELAEIQRVVHDHQVEALLWIGKGPRPELHDEEAGPSHFLTVNYDVLRIPYYNLRVLLGESNLERMRAGSDLFRNEVVAITRPKEGTLMSKRDRQLLIDLWQLEGYLGYS